MAALRGFSLAKISNIRIAFATFDSRVTSARYLTNECNDHINIRNTTPRQTSPLADGSLLLKLKFIHLSIYHYCGFGGKVKAGLPGTTKACFFQQFANSTAALESAVKLEDFLTG